MSSHSKYSVVDHWFELFKARLTNEAEADVNAMRFYIAKKQFEVMPSDLNYRDVLHSTSKYNQLIVLERGLYLLQKDGPYIFPLEPSPGQPQEHFEPTDAPYDAPITLDFYKPGEQARINAYLESDYCLCEICQSERARLGII